MDPKHARRRLLVFIVDYNLQKNAALIEDYIITILLFYMQGEIVETMNFMVFTTYSIANNKIIITNLIIRS